MSWHIPGPSVGVKARIRDAPGPHVWTEGSPQARPLCPASSEPRLTTCGLCPEPGLVPASTLSNHLLEVHQGEVFECAACKDGGVSVVSVNFAGIKDHVRKVHKIQESMVTSAVTCPNIPSLAAFICVNCNNNEDSRIWFSESDAYQHIDNIHGQFFRKKLLAATCRLCDMRGSSAEIQSHVVQCRMKIEFENEVSEEEIKDFSAQKSSGPTLLIDSKVSVRKDIYKNTNLTANVIKEKHEKIESTEDVNVPKKLKRKSTKEKSLDGELESSKKMDKSSSRRKSDSTSSIQKPKMMKISVRSSSCSSSGFSSSDSPRKGRRSKKSHKRKDTPRKESSSKSSQDRHSSPMSHIGKHISRSEERSKTRGIISPLSPRYTRGSSSKSPDGNNSGYFIAGTLSPLYRSPPRGYRGRSPPRYRSRSPHHHQPFSPFDLRHSIRHKQTVQRHPIHDKNRNRIVSRGQHYIKYENGESQCNICGEISPNQAQYKEHLSNEKHRKAVKQIANEVLRKHAGRSRSEDRSVDDPENNLHTVGKFHASKLGTEDLQKNKAKNAQAAQISGENAPVPVVVKVAQFGNSHCPKCHKRIIRADHFHCEICKICCRSSLTYEQHIAGKSHAENVQEKSKGRGEQPRIFEASVRKCRLLPPKSASSSNTQSIASSSNSQPKDSSKPTSDLQCHGCDQRFGSVSALRRHIHHVHGFIIKCSECEAEGQTPAEVLTCKALIGHYLKAHNKAIEDYDLNLYGTVNNWKQGYVRCKLCTMRLGGPGLWFTNSLDKTVIRTHFKTDHGNIASNVTPLSQIVLGCQLCTISDFSSSSTFSWQTHLATHKRNTDAEESTSQTESTGAGNLVTGPCFYCGDKVVKSGNAEQMHVRNMHFELSFRCKMCKGKQTCYEKLEDVEEHLEKRHSWHPGNGKIKAAQVDMPGNKGDLLGFAWVRCKRLGCGFTGIGLRSETLGHQAKAHNGGGIKSFNIFCRLCAGNKKVDRSTEVFDDASDFIAHMRQRHQELVELLSDS